MGSASPPSVRTRVRRSPRRADYEPHTVAGILDEGLVCHVGIAVDGQPFVLPMAYGRVGGVLYLHGSTASRTMRIFAADAPVCVTVTLLDGLVLARSAFHHSMNYRSVVVLGIARPVTGDEQRLTALRAITEHVVPGRWAELRPPTGAELKATAVGALSLSEASAKIRTGPPIDDDADLGADLWAGTVPLRLQAGRPQADEHVPPGTGLPRALAADPRCRSPQEEPQS
ncbi:MAG: pyridoxamine 5'-phosphate oxidase family protein [Nitriliruptorales bacterium]|nr:pyridoxamine 5'-phosphate oxidase family protein [Nitriliruptorales bacterium]